MSAGELSSVELPGGVLSYAHHSVAVFKINTEQNSFWVCADNIRNTQISILLLCFLNLFVELMITMNE